MSESVEFAQTHCSALVRGFIIPGRWPPEVTKPESTEGGRLVSILKWPEGAPLNLG